MLLQSYGKGSTLNVQNQYIAIVSVEWDIVDLLESCGRFSIVGFFDAFADRFTGEFRHLGSDEEWSRMRGDIPDLKIALAIDDPHTRARLYTHYGSEAVVSLRSPHAYVSSRASVGHGSIVQRGVTVMPNVQVGKACKINVNGTLHHDVKVGDFSTIAPGAHLLGNVVIEENVYVGAASTIRQRCRIGAGAIIGAGAVVVRDVPPGEVVVGVPASRRLR